MSEQVKNSEPEQVSSNPDQIEMSYEEAMEYMEQFSHNEPDVELTDEQNEVIDRCFEWRRHGRDLYYLDDYASAAKFFQRIADAYDEAGIGNFSFVVENLCSLGWCYVNIGNYALASHYLLRAVDGYKELGKNILLSLALAYTYLGFLYERMENLEMSIDFFKKALEIYIAERVPMLILRTQNRIADCYVDLEDYEQALAYYSHTISNITLVNDDIQKAFSRVGYIHSLGDNTPDAIEEVELYFQAAIKAATMNHGEESFETGSEWNRFALAMHRMLQYDKAEQHYKQALEIIEKSIAAEPDNEHYNRRYLRVMDNLGMLYVDWNRVADALDVFERVVVQMREMYGDDHPRVKEIEASIAELSFKYMLPMGNAKLS